MKSGLSPQCQRVLDYIRAHPGCSSLTLAVGARSCNYTARITELRAAGYDIEARRVGTSESGASVFEYEEKPRGQQVMSFAAAGASCP